MHLYRITFLSGVAAGFVLGTRAGRERYDQMMKIAKSATESPAFQQAAGAVQTQAASLLSSASGKVTGELQDRVPKLAQTAMHKAGDHIPGKRHKNGHGSSNGHDSKAGPADSHHATDSSHNGGRHSNT